STSLCQSLQLLPLIYSLMNYAPIHRNSVYQRSVTIEKMGHRREETEGSPDSKVGTAQHEKMIASY
ncbi:MAG: hypothetical protein ACKO90_24140, partial [Microcystis panniformis]